MAVPVFTHPDCLRHDPGSDHPETPARLRVLLERARQSTRGDRGARRRPRRRIRCSRCIPTPTCAACEAMSAPGRRRPVPRHHSQRGQLARRARRHRRGARRGGPRARRPRPRVRGRAPAGPPCARVQGDGLLPGEQRRRRRAARPARRPRAGADHRLGRAPRERHPGAGGGRRHGPLRLAAPAPVVSRHRHGGRARRRQRFQRAAGARRLPAALYVGRSLGRDRRRDRPTGRRTWCWSPPASTPWPAIRSAASPSSPSTTPISPAGSASGCRVRPSSACSRAATCPSRLADGAWPTSARSPSDADLTTRRGLS